MDKIESCIASPHWEACYTCQFHSDNGCDKADIDLSVHHGDWILCDDYVRKPGEVNKQGVRDEEVGDRNPPLRDHFKE